MENRNKFWIKAVTISYILFWVTAFCCGLSVNAQTDTVFIISDIEKVVLKPQSEQNGIVANLEVCRMSYSVKITGTGQYYLNYTDATGKLRRKYLGWMPEQNKHDVTIFCNRKKTKFWYWQFGSNDLPTKKYLPEQIHELL